MVIRHEQSPDILSSYNRLFLRKIDYLPEIASSTHDIFLGKWIDSHSVVINALQKLKISTPEVFIVDQEVFPDQWHVNVTQTKLSQTLIEKIKAKHFVDCKDYWYPIEQDFVLDRDKSLSLHPLVSSSIAFYDYIADIKKLRNNDIWVKVADVTFSSRSKPCTSLDRGSAVKLDLTVNKTLEIIYISDYDIPYVTAKGSFTHPNLVDAEIINLNKGDVIDLTYNIMENPILCMFPSWLEFKARYVHRLGNSAIRVFRFTTNDKLKKNSDGYIVVQTSKINRIKVIGSS